MPLEPGTRLGLFEILGPIGAGGMGEVYRARDTRLGREVAIKVLPEAFCRDPVRVGRFEREARMLASINHPAIAAIYGAEESGDIRYIVMELVPGDTLAEWMARGALSLEESLSFARQTAEALEAAHEKGVVHRDLKPSNIKVTPGGKIKVLDLGLAKMMEERTDVADASKSPTAVLQEETRPGVILGTAEFMSPEQARGKEIDKRTDIWAFGCILFEMLSGRRTFTGETISDILAAILTKEPSWESLPSYTPPRIRELLSRCLQKDANQRLRDIGDARLDIERTLAQLDEKTGVTRSRRPILVSGALLLLVIAGIWLGARAVRQRSVASPEPKYLVVLPFKDLSGSAQGQLLGDGLVVTISARLNRVPGIQVVTPSAAIAATDKESDPFRVAKSLGANLILRGAIQRERDRMRITYSVLRAPGGVQVAGDDVTGSESELFALQDQLTDKVAAALKLSAGSRRAPIPSGLETASQQERYIEALGHLQRYDKPTEVKEAVRLLETLASERPASPLIHAALARAYLYEFNDTRESRWVELAERSCSRAQQLSPEFPEVEVTLGELRMRTGKAQEAIASFQRALSTQPDNFQALLGLAEALDADGHIGQAETTYRRAVQLQPSYWSGYSKLAGFYYEHGRYAKAAETFGRVTQMAPDNANAFSNLGAAYQMMGEFEKALDSYKTSLALAPTDAAYSNLGTAHFYLGHYRESADAFQEAVGRTPEHFLFWANLGDAERWAKGLQAKAPDAYRQAIKLARAELHLNPGNGQAHAYLALCLAKTNQHTEAEEQMREALALKPSDPEFLYDAAVVSNLGGRPAEALQWLRRALGAGYSRAIVERDPELARLRAGREFHDVFRSLSERRLGRGGKPCSTTGLDSQPGSFSCLLSA